MTMYKSVYLAGPITGESWRGATDWRDYAAEWLWTVGIEGYSPLRGKDSYLAQEKVIDMEYRHPLSTAKGIFARDLNDVMTRDLLLANFLGSRRVSIGTVWEIGIAVAMRKPIVLVMEEGNVHDHSLLIQSAGFVLDDLDEALDIVHTILNP